MSEKRTSGKEKGEFVNDRTATSDDRLATSSGSDTPWEKRERHRTDTSHAVPRGALLREPTAWPLLYHTARNMQVRQLAGVLERSLRHTVIPKLPTDYDSTYEQQVPETTETDPDPVLASVEGLRSSLTASTTERYRELTNATADGTITFLNTPLSLGVDGGIEWFHSDVADQPALWALKLHGFEFLRWPVFGLASPADCPEAHALIQQLIRDWNGSPETDIGTDSYLRRAWTPHAVSLRILNLSRYYCWCLSEETDTEFLDELEALIYKNAAFLSNHVEHDVGGNHLIENAVALVSAGILFDDPDTDWLETGITILQEAESQFLGDGGHFERSPMYHIITLTRYLTVLDLLDESDRGRPAALEHVAKRGTAFLRSIRPPDGRIPLLNDAVFGQALEIDECLAYARAVGVPQTQTVNPALAGSGYFWLGHEESRLLVDGGAFGPPHLPAHSHNDLLSILLWVDGRRILTDTGTYHYAPTPRRHQARSVEGHNTVQVGSSEPVPIGGQYLAGRRVQPTVRYVKTDDITMFDGAYTRYELPNGKYRHRRRIYARKNWWLIQDQIAHDDSHNRRHRLHFHPSVTPISHPTAEHGAALAVEDETLAYILPSTELSITETTSPYFPEFGVEKQRQAFVLESTPEVETTNILLSTAPLDRSSSNQLKQSLEQIDHRAIEPPL